MTAPLATRAWQALVDLVYPPRCLVCRRPPRQGRDCFCERCASELFHDPDAACPRCAATIGPYADHDGRCGLCRHESLRFDAAVRLGPYGGRWSGPSCS
jgi:predicted amidophosphoribosyltransferase